MKTYRCTDRMCGADDCETCHPVQRSAPLPTSTIYWRDVEDPELGDHDSVMVAVRRGNHVAVGEARVCGDRICWLNGNKIFGAILFWAPLPEVAV